MEQHEDIETISVHHTQLHRKIPDFFTAEDLGVAPAKLCAPCKGCSTCGFLRQNVTKEETEVMERQDQLLKLNVEKGHMEAQYAFTEDVKRLGDNMGQAYRSRRESRGS